MKGTILQPTYLPWLGYFEMLVSSDIYVIFDHVQFVKKSWQHRNRIKTSNGELLLTVPIGKQPRGCTIANTKLSKCYKRTLEKHWKTICLSYQKSPFFTQYRPRFEKLFQEDYVYLPELTVRITKEICDILKINTKIIFSSSLDLQEKNFDTTGKVINLCKKVGINNLYDAQGAAAILEVPKFKEADIDITFQNYRHPVYSQQWGEFLPYMSVIDLLFNEGESSKNIILSGAT